MQSYPTIDIHPNLLRILVLAIIENWRELQGSYEIFESDQCDGAANYRPHSFIQLDVWKASPPSSKGNKPSHRAVYCDSVNLAGILGGTMWGWQYDRRAFRSIDLHAGQGIYTRNQVSTHFYRFGRSVDRVGTFVGVLVFMGITTYQLAVSVQGRTAHRSLGTEVAQNGKVDIYSAAPTTCHSQLLGSWGWPYPGSNPNVLLLALAPKVPLVANSDMLNVVDFSPFESASPASKSFETHSYEDLMYHDQTMTPREFF